MEKVLGSNNMKYPFHKILGIRYTEIHNQEEAEIANTFYYFLGLADRIKFPIAYKQMFRKALGEYKKEGSDGRR